MIFVAYSVMTNYVIVCHIQTHTHTRTVGLARDVRSHLSKHKVTMVKKAIKQQSQHESHIQYRPLFQTNKANFRAALFSEMAVRCFIKLTL